MFQNVIKGLVAPHGCLTGFELDLSRRSTDKTAMESPSIATPGNVEKERDKFVSPVDVDFTSGLALKVIDLTGEVVKNATPRPLEKKGQKFVPPVNVDVDLTGEDSRNSGTLVRLRLDRESPEEAGREQSVGNKAAEDSKDTSLSSIRPDQEPPGEAGQPLQSLEIASVAAESQGDSQAAETWPQAITILSDGDGDDKDENKSERGNSVSDNAADVNAENNEDVSGTSRRQDRGQDEEPPEENEQLFQAPVAKIVATDVPPVSLPSVKLEHPESAAESQGDSQAAENCPQAIMILSDDDEHDKDENRSKRGPSMSDKAADLNLEVSNTSRREDEWPLEEAVQLLQSPVAKSVATGIPQRGFTEEETLCRRGKQRKVNNGGDVLNNLVSYENLHSSLIPFVENAILPANVKRRKVNHGDDLLHDAGYEQLPIQCQVEPMHVESPFSEDADRAVGHQEARFTPVVENAKFPASVKQQKVNHGVDEHSPMEAIQQVNESMKVESDGHKSSQSGKPGKQDSIGKVERDKNGADLELHPSFEKTLHLHQKKGFKFLTRNLFGGQHGGYESSGCVLAHAPGTGKTCLVISFIQSFLTRFPEGKPLILAPAIMLQAWKDQFERWMVKEVPIYTLGGSARDQYEEDASLAPHVKTSLKEARALELREWQKGRSILLLSYNLFLRLVSNGLEDNVIPNSLDDQITKALKESANLAILDEGHIARNNDSLITQAILALETKRRVLLSGTLFHNNFEELFTLLKICRDDFMSSDPEFAKEVLKYSSGISSLKEHMQIEKEIFMNQIGNRLQNWEKSGVTSTDGIESVVKKFQSLTSPFVDRYPGEILKTLPGLIEHSIHLNLTAFQSEEIIDRLVKSEQVKNHFLRHHKITAACIHPSLALVGEEASRPFSTRSFSPLQDEARKGVKISFILQLMESSNIAKEKLLIFCSTLRPITYIEDLCCKIWGWRKGQQILRLDGGMSDVDRQKAIQKFNDSGSQSQVLLASTFACKEGISLVGASRVVILDCVYNPSVIRQAVSRAFRMGQKKKVYVYRLVTMHSYEVQVFRRSVSKEKLSLVLLDPVSTISNVGKFLQKQRASDVEDELLRQLMLADGVNGSHINSVQRYNALSA